MPLRDEVQPVTSPVDPKLANPSASPSGKVVNRAIRDQTQGRDLIKRTLLLNVERNRINARIMAKYNSEKPYDSERLKQDGVGWKSNFSTKPLSTLIDKVAPRFAGAIESARYLTSAQLPDDVPGASDKTSAFRREVTETIRGRQEWRSFVDEFALENALFGFTSVVWLDEFLWFPKHIRQGDFGVPTGTKQTASHAQLFVARESFLIHEIFDLVSDKETAEAAGWNVSAVTELINKAMPEKRRSKYGDWHRVYEDLVRESCVGSSHEEGAKVVQVTHLLATELTGKVSHYIFGGDSDVLLFEREDRYDAMPEALCFYTFQQGNSTLYGSKGIGREIYNLAAMLDRSRNEVVDRLNLSGKLIIQATEKDLPRFKMSVVGNALLIGSGFTINENKLDGNVEPFIALDNYLGALLDQIAGATSPKFLQGERVTKAQVDLYASREEENRDSILGRFLQQFSVMMQTIQRRMCDSKTTEDDAKAMQKRLLTIMSREELDQLANTPVVGTVQDFTDKERLLIISAATENKGNPLYNQKELEKRKLTAQINEEFAESVLLPDNDPTMAAEQNRQAQLENLLLLQGATVPVSPRDNAEEHLKVVVPAMEHAAAEAMQNPAGLALLKILTQHASDHIQMAIQHGVDPKSLEQYSSIVKQVQAQMQKLDALEQQQHLVNAGVHPEDATVPAEMQQPTPPQI